MALAIDLIVETIKTRYREVDEHLEHVKKARSFACKKGCDYCCYQMVSANLPESLVITEAIKKNSVLKKEFVKKIPTLKKEIALLKNPNTSTKTWFKKSIPCIFLKNHLCSVYEHRPLACRTQLAAEDNSDRCKITAPGPVRLFNNRKMIELFLNESIEISRQFGTLWIPRPLQITLLDAWTNGVKPTKLSDEEQIKEMYTWSLLERR